VARLNLTPEERAARRREQNRINKAAQRARDAAGIKAARPGPPRVSGTPYERAIAQAQITRERRRRIIESLPQARNPSETIRVTRETRRAPAAKKTKAGQVRQAKAIRESTRESSSTRRGAAYKASIVADVQAAIDGSKHPYSAFHRRQLLDAARRISRVSAQALGILLEYENGVNESNLWIERIYYPIDGPDEVIDMGDRLANLAEAAEATYGRRAVGDLNL